jgi:hypothetical protein
MPAVIDTSPACVNETEGYVTDDGTGVADDADFILQANYADCAGFMTMGPGSTYGEDGVGGEGAYIALAWVGIAFMVVALIAFVLFEANRLRRRVESTMR